MAPMFGGRPAETPAVYSGDLKNGQTLGPIGLMAAGPAISWDTPVPAPVQLPEIEEEEHDPFKLAPLEEVHVLAMELMELLSSGGLPCLLSALVQAGIVLANRAHVISEVAVKIYEIIDARNRSEAQFFFRELRIYCMNMFRTLWAHGPEPLAASQCIAWNMAGFMGALSSRKIITIDDAVLCLHLLMDAGYTHRRLGGIHAFVMHADGKLIKRSSPLKDKQKKPSKVLEMLSALTQMDDYGSAVWCVTPASALLVSDIQVALDSWSYDQLARRKHKQTITTEAYISNGNMPVPPNTPVLSADEPSGSGSSLGQAVPPSKIDRQRETQREERLDRKRRRSLVGIHGRRFPTNDLFCIDERRIVSV